MCGRGKGGARTARAATGNLAVFAEGLKIPAQSSELTQPVKSMRCKSLGT